MKTDALERLNQDILAYALTTKKAAAEIVAEKGLQLLLGSHSNGANFEGLFGEFYKKAPPSGKITATVNSLFKSSAGLKISQKSYAKADRVLGGKPAGLFVKNKVGKAVVVRQITRGKNIGRHKTSRRIKNATDLLGRARVLGLLRQDGEIVLNRQALAANFEIRKREGGRYYSASAFLYKRYRRLIRQLAGRQYRRGQLVGVNSVDAAMMHEHVKVAVKNKTGSVLGTLEGDTSGRECWLKVSVYTSNIDKAGFRLITDRVMGRISADIHSYLTSKLARSASAVAKEFHS